MQRYWARPMSLRERVLILGVLGLLWSTEHSDAQPVLSGPSGGVYYSGKNIYHPLGIDFSVNDDGSPQPWTIEVEIKNARCVSHAAPP